jgi:hypothetical protein
MTMSEVGSRPGPLPVTRNLTLAYASSLLIALIMTVASAAGLLYQAAVYPADEVVLAFAPSDVFNLAVGLPMLLLSMWLARRGNLIGLLCWPGALFYVVYMYVPYVIGVPFNVLFLPYLLLVVLSAYTLIGLVASIDGEVVRQRLAGSVPARFSAGILLALAILIIVRQTAVIVGTLAGQAPVNRAEFSSWVADFTVAVPLLLGGGIQLWRRQPLGYVAGAGLLLGYTILALSLIPFTALHARYTASPMDAGIIVVVPFMATLCFIPFMFFVRAAGSARNPSYSDDRLL